MKALFVVAATLAASSAFARDAGNASLANANSISAALTDAGKFEERFAALIASASRAGITPTRTCTADACDTRRVITYGAISVSMTERMYTNGTAQRIECVIDTSVLKDMCVDNSGHTWSDAYRSDGSLLSKTNLQEKWGDIPPG